nr:hypothetical protein [Methylobacterium terricola]
MSPMKPAFDGLPHGGEQMPSIGDLLRLGSAKACTSSILGRAITGDECDAGLPFEPAGHRGCGVIREEVDDAVTVEIDDDRAVSAALPDRPVVDPDPDGSERVGHRQAGDEPQHSRAACWRMEVRKETRARLHRRRRCRPWPAPRQAAACARRAEAQGRLGEGPASAGRVEAVEPPSLDAEPGLRCRYRQVDGLAVVAAMDGPAGTTAVGASTISRVQPHRDDEVILVSLDEPRDPALGDGEGNVHAIHDGEAGSAYHRPEAVHRHPR